MGSQPGASLYKQTLLWFIVAVSQCVLTLGCGPHYDYAIEEFCLAKFRLDMQELDQRRWCNWEDTVELYGDLTNCTYLVALKMECFWPNQMVDEFFIQVHKHYFHDCSLSGRLLRDPPNRILGPFIVVPILVTLLMTALVVWRSKRSEGIM
ncbi:receptor activity-modifying protein 1 [Solea senegalensis]|uniref:Receptor activity-modifying protein 1 n=1 Tax=Solea senegalensis TaxID=28829 RepID=A0AAV6RDJ1_SOLSE|nr:receptor activity-modifying protein 1 isoform X1 [Solea senegalensis]KAG7503617.1 receptor activity-modifying protein 1 [Solea senegalensis]